MKKFIHLFFIPKQMSDKIKTALEIFKKELDKYTKIFKESGGGIDAEEQKKLDEMKAKIKACEDKLLASSGIPSPDGIVSPKKEEPVKEIDFSNLTKIDPSLLPQLDMSWTQDVNEWLDKNTLNLRLNLIKDTISFLRKDVKGLENVDDKQLRIYIKNWAKNNYISLDKEKKEGKSEVETAMDDFFSEFKKIGKFDWKFGGGSLKLDLVGQTAKLGYKQKNLEASVTAGTSDVKVEVSGKVDDVKGKIEGKVKYDGSGDGSISVEKNKVTGKVGVEVDKEGKVKGSASLKIADVINFGSSTGSISVSLKGDKSSWSFGIEISTSGGKQAHLSRKAASEIKNVIYKATSSLKEIYKILEAEELTIENAKAIKKKIDPYWKDVDKAITLLSKDIKKPAKAKSEVFVSFGISDSKDIPGGPMITGGLTLTF